MVQDDNIIPDELKQDEPENTSDPGEEPQPVDTMGVAQSLAKSIGQHIKVLEQVNERGAGTRELSLAKTKLEEARMWLKAHGNGAWFD